MQRGVRTWRRIPTLSLKVRCYQEWCFGWLFRPRVRWVLSSRSALLCADELSRLQVPFGPSGGLSVGELAGADLGRGCRVGFEGLPEEEHAPRIGNLGPAPPRADCWFSMRPLKK